ncbi:MAG: hypothetical protein ABFE07_06165 [Armatimonadia bacterium]
MATVTYIGEEPANGSFLWHGEVFAVGVPVETAHPVLLKQVRTNRFFTVVDEEELIDGEVDTPFERGAKAALDGKKRTVPPAYRGKPSGEQWQAGYDKAAG